MKKVLLLMVLILVVGVSSVKAVDSYELFWPMVAGKTTADGFVYKLKILKEDVRGYLIFGPVQKADYHVFRAAKRLLEAEKLLLDKKDKTLMHLSAAKRGSENIKTLATDMALMYKDKTEVAKKLQEISQFAP